MHAQAHVESNVRTHDQAHANTKSPSTYSLPRSFVRDEREACVIESINEHVACVNESINEHGACVNESINEQGACVDESELKSATDCGQ